MNTPGSMPVIASQTAGTAPLAPYSTPTTGAAIDLFLDANEGPGGCVDVAQLAATLPRDTVRRYAGPGALERQLAARFGLEPGRVLVTAGGDEAIDRACRAFLGPGKELILPIPTFEMIGRYAKQVGATIQTTAWDEGPYPIEGVLRLINERTAVIAVVSPNNPTGAIATAEDLRRLAAAAPRALLLVDLAYTEFADDDLTAAVLHLPNAIAIRTFSKAFGLAGLRVGYALGQEPIVQAMRASGSPFPVSTLSLAVAAEALRRAPGYLPGVVATVRAERDSLFQLLRELDARPLDSQGNFVLAEFADADWVWRGLASLGIGVRRYKPEAGLDRCLRITCPGDAASFTRLCAGLRHTLRPGSLLLDLDGMGPAGLGYTQDTETIAALRTLRRRRPLVLASRRSRAECRRGLEVLGITDLFETIVAAEDAAELPPIAAAKLATDRLGLAHSWAIASTPEAVEAALGSRFIPIGLVPTGSLGGDKARTLLSAGAARVIDSLTSLEQLLP
jgi:histidinol-phosphate aminotransferase